MMALRLGAPPVPSPRHAPTEEYDAFVRASSYAVPEQRNLMSFRARFVRRYPDLSGCFAAPLAERVGLVYDEHGSRSEMVCSTSYRARRYLLFLAVRGYASLDWDWLLAVPRLESAVLLQDVGVDIGLERLVDEAAALGYTGCTRPASSLGW